MVKARSSGTWPRFSLDTAVDDSRAVGAVEVAAEESTGDTDSRISRVPHGALGNDKSRSHLKPQLFQSIAKLPWRQAERKRGAGLVPAASPDRLEQ